MRDSGDCDVTGTTLTQILMGSSQSGLPHIATWGDVHVLAECVLQGAHADIGDLREFSGGVRVLGVRFNRQNCAFEWSWVMRSERLLTL
jgi:hypothetical protein